MTRAEVAAMVEKEELHGIVAVFESPDELVDAAHKTYHAGYRKINAYTPIPCSQGACLAAVPDWPCSTTSTSLITH